jgi:hypothetical protein
MALTLKYKNNRTALVHTPEEVVDQFLDLHENWWSNITALPTNALFGQKARYRSLLIEYLRNGEEIPDIDHEAIYVINEFDNEWLPFFTVELE